MAGVRRMIRGVLALPLGGRLNGTDRLRLLPSAYVDSYEADVWEVVLSAVRPGATFVDVGANVGFYAVAAARRGARVVAFEPDPHNARAIAWHARLNRANVHVVEAAVSDVDEPIIFAARGTPVSGAADLYVSEMSMRVVPAVRLDSLFLGYGIDILKIDVERLEEHVLRGARGLLADAGHRPALVMVEVHDRELADGVDAELTGAGYVWNGVSSETGFPSRRLYRSST